MTQNGEAGGSRRLYGQQRRRLAGWRRRRAEQMVRTMQARTQAGRWTPRQPLVMLLVAFLAIGALVTADMLLSVPPDNGRTQLIFLLASGLAIWGLVGLVIVFTRRAVPERQFSFVAYDALRQGLLVAGCLELNLATRMLDLWTPLIGSLFVAVFAVFEVVTLGRRPA